MAGTCRFGVRSDRGAGASGAAAETDSADAPLAPVDCNSWVAAQVSRVSEIPGCVILRRVISKWLAASLLLGLAAAGGARAQALHEDVAYAGEADGERTLDLFVPAPA